MIDQLLCVRFGIQILVGLCPYQACVRMCVCAHAQLGLTRFNPVDSSRPGSSVYGILQEKILEWVAMPFSRGSSWLRGWTRVSCFAGGLFICWAMWEARPCQVLWIIQSKSSEWHRRTPLTSLLLPLSRALSSSSVNSLDTFSYQTVASGAGALSERGCDFFWGQREFSSSRW